MNPGWRKRCLRLLSLISGNLRLQSSATTYSQSFHRFPESNYPQSQQTSNHRRLGLFDFSIRAAQRSSNEIFALLTNQQKTKSTTKVPRGGAPFLLNYSFLSTASDAFASAGTYTLASGFSTILLHQLPLLLDMLTL